MPSVFSAVLNHPKMTLKIQKMLLKLSSLSVTFGHIVCFCRHPNVNTRVCMCVCVGVCVCHVCVTEREREGKECVSVVYVLLFFFIQENTEACLGQCQHKV